MLSILIVLTSIVSTPEQTINVNVSEFSPLVINSNGEYTGFEIELWKEIAHDLNLQTNFINTDFNSIFDNITNGTSDVGLAGISITSERESNFDFSIPTFNSGVSIAVLKQDQNYFQNIISIFYKKEFIHLILYFFGFLVIAAHVLWVTELTRDDGISDSYFPGIFDAFWCILATVSTVGFGDVTPKRWIGRAITAIVMFVGIAFFGTFISEMANVKKYMEAKNLTFDELKNCEIGTMKDTISVKIVKQNNCIPIEVGSEKELIDLLISGKVCGIMFDTPWILNLQKSNPDIVSLPDQFFENYYGFVFPENSELKKKVDISILKLKESGKYKQLYNTWF